MLPVRTQSAVCGARLLLMVNRPVHPDWIDHDFTKIQIHSVRLGSLGSPAYRRAALMPAARELFLWLIFFFRAYFSFLPPPRPLSVQYPVADAGGRLGRLVGLSAAAVSDSAALLAIHSIIATMESNTELD